MLFRSVNRTISMSNKYFNGVVCDKDIVEDVDADLKAMITSTIDKVFCIGSKASYNPIRLEM